MKQILLLDILFLIGLLSFLDDMAYSQSETVTIFEQKTTVRQVVDTRTGGLTTYEWNSGGDVSKLVEVRT